MTREEHIARHKMLHKYFDELIADYCDHTEKLMEETTILELLRWSYIQTYNPLESGQGET